MPDKFHEEGTSRSIVEALFLRRNTAELISWQPDGQALCVRYSPGLIEEVAAMAMAGFARSPWGGVEIGGVLFGKRESDGVSIYSYRRLDSEHQFGPSYALSTRDVEHMDQLLADAKNDDDLKDLVAVGWFHSVSEREFCLTDHDVALHNHCFPAPWQVAIVLRRSRKRPVLAGFFVRESSGSLPPRPSYTITLEDLRPRLPGGHAPELKLTSGSSSATSGSAAANARTGPARPSASPEKYPMPAAPGVAYQSHGGQRSSDDAPPPPVVEVREPRPRKPLSILKRFLTPVVDVPASEGKAVESSEPAPAKEPATAAIAPVLDVERPASAAAPSTIDLTQASDDAEPILAPAVEMAASQLTTAESSEPAETALEPAAAEQSPALAGLVQSPKFSAARAVAPDASPTASPGPEPVATPEIPTIHLVGLSGAGLNSAELNRVGPSGAGLNPPELRTADSVKPPVAEGSAPEAKAPVSGSPEPFATPKRLRIPSFGLKPPDLEAAGSVKSAVAEGSAPEAKAPVSGSPGPFATPKRLLIPSFSLKAPELSAAGGVKPPVTQSAAPAASAHASGFPESFTTSGHLLIPTAGLSTPEFRTAGAVLPAAAKVAAPAAKARVSPPVEALASPDRVLIPALKVQLPHESPIEAPEPAADAEAPATEVIASVADGIAPAAPIIEALAQPEELTAPATEPAAAELLASTVEVRKFDPPQAFATPEPVPFSAVELRIPELKEPEPAAPSTNEATAAPAPAAELLASTVEGRKFDPPQAFATPEPVPFSAVELKILELKQPEPAAPSTNEATAAPAPAAELLASTVEVRKFDPPQAFATPEPVPFPAVELTIPELKDPEISNTAPAAVTTAPAAAELLASAAELLASTVEPRKFDPPQAFATPEPVPFSAVELKIPARKEPEPSNTALAAVTAMPAPAAELLTSTVEVRKFDPPQAFATPEPVPFPAVELTIPELKEPEIAAPSANEAPVPTTEVPPVAIEAPAVAMDAPAAMIEASTAVIEAPVAVTAELVVESPAPAVEAKESRPPKRSWIPKRFRIPSFGLGRSATKAAEPPASAAALEAPAVPPPIPESVLIPAAEIPVVVIHEAELQTLEGKVAEAPQLAAATEELAADRPVLEASAAQAPAVETPAPETRSPESLPPKRRWIPKTLELEDFKPRTQESQPSKRRWVPLRLQTPSVEPAASVLNAPGSPEPAPVTNEPAAAASQLVVDGERSAAATEAHQPDFLKALATPGPAAIPVVLISAVPTTEVGLPAPETAAMESSAPGAATEASPVVINVVTDIFARAEEAPAPVTASTNGFVVNGYQSHALKPAEALKPTPAVPSRTSETPGSFFGLSRDPFSVAPFASLLEASPRHKAVLTTLLYGVQARKGFLPLIGPSGTAKTIVLECLMEKLDQQSVDFAFIINPSKMTAAQFFEFLDFDLDLNSSRKTKSAVLIALNERLIERFQQGRTTVLIVDNAHLAPLDVLREIELIGNLENRHGKLLQVVFAGQPAFESLLEHRDLLGFRQSISFRARLAPFTPEQTAAYIESRLASAGLTGQTVFAPDLLSQIHVRTRGLPRLIHAVCGGLLRVCFEAGIRTANVEMLHLISVDPALDRTDGAYGADSSSANAAARAV